MDQHTTQQKSLNAAQVARYREQGFLSPVNALSADEARAARAQVEAIEAKHGGTWPRAQSLKSHLIYPFLDRIVHHPAILDVVEDVLGPNLLCWSTSFFIKEPRDPGFVSWHQDATYWGLNKPDVTTLWLAITPANKINGCMKFIAGTHKQQVSHTDTFDKNNLLTRGQEIAVEVDEKQAVYVELKPGQASLHHVLLFHGSAPNLSDDRRIGFAIRYVPTYVKQAVGQKDSATLVRGVDEFHNFEHEPRPQADLHPDAVAFHKAITERQVKVLYRGTGKDAYRP